MSMSNFQTTSQPANYNVLHRITRKWASFWLPKQRKGHWLHRLGASVKRQWKEDSQSNATQRKQTLHPYRTGVFWMVGISLQTVRLWSWFPGTHSATSAKQDRLKLMLHPQTFGKCVNKSPVSMYDVCMCMRLCCCFQSMLFIQNQILERNILVHFMKFEWLLLLT